MCIAEYCTYHLILFQSQLEVHQAWTTSGLAWSDILQPATNLEEFVKLHVSVHWIDLMKIFFNVLILYRVWITQHPIPKAQRILMK